VTSILGGIFPPGLVVGQLSDVNKNDVGSFQTARILPAFDIVRDQQVFVASGKYPLEPKSAPNLPANK
jgi:rod shape-determining protein MreC